jgi:hypothetical protein
VFTRGDRGKGQFGQGFGDADYGFQLPNCDGDGASGVAFNFILVYLFANLDEMAGELLGCFGAQTRRTAAGLC